MDGIFFLDEHERGFFSEFWSSSGFFFVFQDSAYFLTDARYLSAARQFFQNSEIKVLDFLKPEEWDDFFKKNGISRLGMDFSKISAERLRNIRRHFGIKISPFSAHHFRAYKTAEQIFFAETAAKIADSALEKTLSFLQVGVSEKEIAWILEKIGREEFGAEKNAFDPIVAFGKNSAIPHHVPTDQKLDLETPILIDWGFQKNHLCSDCTRNFWFGKNPSSKWISVFEWVSAAQAGGIEKMKIGKRISEVQKTAEIILGEKIPHSFGHGVGVEVHEFPMISQKQKGVFRKNMLVTAEPGWYTEGEFGIRIEDLLVIEKAGARRLTHFSRDLEQAILAGKKYQ